MAVLRVFLAVLMVSTAALAQDGSRVEQAITYQGAAWAVLQSYISEIAPHILRRSSEVTFYVGYPDTIDIMPELLVCSPEDRISLQCYSRRLLDAAEARREAESRGVTSQEFYPVIRLSIAQGASPYRVTFFLWAITSDEDRDFGPSEVRYDLVREQGEWKIEKKMWYMKM